MFFYLFLLLVTVPLIEFWLLYRLAVSTNLITTILIVISTGGVGSFLARQQGIATLNRFRIATAEGRMPSEEIRDGAMILFAGALLLTPGILTDAFGFLLLIPWSRSWLGRILAQRFSGSLQVHPFGQPPEDSDFQGDDPRSPRNRNTPNGDTIQADGVRRIDE